MARVRLLIAISAAILLLAIQASTVSSQIAAGQLQPGFNEALSLLQKAEAAGATRSEVAPLVELLNKALELNDEAANLTGPGGLQKRSQLLTQISDQLASVETQASQLENIAAQRTFTDKVISYLSGGVAAFIATLAYAYGTSFWRKYRIRRTFQMRISKK